MLPNTAQSQIKTCFLFLFRFIEYIFYFIFFLLEKITAHAIIHCTKFILVIFFNKFMLQIDLEFFMKGIPVELPPEFTIKETRSNIPQEDSNIPEEERHKSNGVKNVGSGMLLSKLSFLEFWLLTMRITFGQPLLFCYDKYVYVKEYIQDSLYHRRHQ